MQDIRVALGEEIAIEEDDDLEQKPTQHSHDEIVKLRTGRILDLQRRQRELGVLKSMLESKVGELNSMKADIEKRERTFQDQLKQLAATLASESIEQSRAILLKMPVADAVSNLMAMNLEQNVLLLKGMPEKSIAAIFEEFLRGNDPKRIDREQKIFEAIVKGQPNRQLIENNGTPANGTTPPMGPLAAQPN